MGPESHANTVVHGVVAVIERDSRFLIIRRSQAEVAPGAWCFPGGAIQPGETPRQAVRREMMEELDALVEPVEQVWRWQREDGRLDLTWWRADLLRDELSPDPAEVETFRWMTPAEIRTTPGVLPNNITFLDDYLRT